MSIKEVYVLVLGFFMFLSVVFSGFFLVLYLIEVDWKV